MNSTDSTYLICCISVSASEYFSRPMLRHFVEHYLGVGIPPQNFLLTLHSTTSAMDFLPVEAYLRHFRIKSAQNFVADYDCYSFYDANYRLMKRCAPDDWVIMVDFDELIRFPKCLGEFISDLAMGDYNLAMGEIVDRIAVGGHLIPIAESPSIWEQFPVSCRITRDIALGCDSKTCIFRGNLTPNLGHHVVVNLDDAKVFPQLLFVHHFKWDSTLPLRLAKSQRQFHSDKERFFWHRETDLVLERIVNNKLAIDVSESKEPSIKRADP